MFETKHAGILMYPLVRITLQSNCLLCMYRTLQAQSFPFSSKGFTVVGKLITSVSCSRSVVVGWMDGLMECNRIRKSNPLGLVKETLDALQYSLPSNQLA